MVPTTPHLPPCPAKHTSPNVTLKECTDKQTKKLPIIFLPLVTKGMHLPQRAATPLTAYVSFLNDWVKYGQMHKQVFLESNNVPFKIARPHCL